MRWKIPFVTANISSNSDELKCEFTAALASCQGPAMLFTATPTGYLQFLHRLLLNSAEAWLYCTAGLFDLLLATWRQQKDEKSKKATKAKGTEKLVDNSMQGLSHLTRY